jgi:lysophospholipase L1-like esterase
MLQKNPKEKMMSLSYRRFAIVLSLFVAMFCCLATMSTFVAAQDAPAVEAPENPATTPVPREGWWMERHAQKLAEKEAMDQVDLVMIGDSITHGFENRGKAVWEEYYADRNALNLGYSGDRTEHVLWRFEHGEIDNIDPTLITIMIGTNNIGHGSSTPAQTVIGVKTIIAELREKLPEAKILLLAVFPRGATTDDVKRVLVDAINEGLPALCEDDEAVTFLDINGEFLTDDGVLTREVMPDLLHPHEAGYQTWAEAVEPTIAELMGENE